MRLFGALVLVLSGCGGRLIGIGADVTVEPGTLSFPATALGDTRALALTLSNHARAPASLHLSAPAPFALELDVMLGGGASRDVTVTFTPSQLEASSAQLHLDGAVALDVELQGEGVAPVDCASASACRLAQRDAQTNTCVVTTAPDGTSCVSQNACLSGGECIGGTCVGLAVSCDDHDRCTIDACEPTDGCVHFSTTCPAPDDPCQVAVCDAATGCATAPAADGTSCGPSDCVTAHVCLSGVCKVLPVPEGHACGDESPCRPSGHCAHGACDQPPATTLTRAWSLQLKPDVDFRGVTDGSGNLLWVECSAVDLVHPCRLVSVSSSGLERFRVPVASLNSALGSRHLWSQGRIVVASPNGGLSAYSDSTGALLWERAMAQQNTLLGLAADRRGQVLVATRFDGQSQAWWLTTVSAMTGALLRTQGLNGPLSELVLDAQDDVFFEVWKTEQPVGAASSDGGAGPGTDANVHLISFGPMGALRFSVPSDHPDPPVAAFNGELLLASGVVYSTLDGSSKPSTRGQQSFRPPSVLMAQSSRYRWVGDPCDGYDDCSEVPALPNVPYQPFLRLEGWSTGATAPRFTLAASYPGWTEFAEPQLLTDGSALFATDSVYQGGTVLRAIAPSGAEKFSCVLGTDPLIHWRGPTALVSARWAVVEQQECPFCVHDPAPLLRVFFAAGLEVASTGWTGLQGNPGGSGSPR
jgi:hypothetical protein